MKAHTTNCITTPQFEPYTLHIDVESLQDHRALLCLLTTSELDYALKTAAGATIPGHVRDKIIHHGNASIRGEFLHLIRTR